MTKGESTRNVLCVGGKKSVKIRTGFKKNPLNGFKQQMVLND